MTMVYNKLKFYLAVYQCPICGKQMMCKDKNELFPRYVGETQDAQMKEAGIVYISRSKKDDDYICVECEKAGLSSFTCTICEEEKPTSKMQNSFGDPPEYVCLDCYSKIPAKEWDEKIKRIEEAHRYDYE